MKIEAAQRAASISINNIDGNLHAGTLGIGADDSPDLLCDATLTADDFAGICLSYAYFDEHRTHFGVGRFDAYRIGVVNQRHNQGFDQTRNIFAGFRHH